MKISAPLPALLLAGILFSCADPNVQGGNLHVDQGRSEEAEALYRKAIAENPDNPEAHYRLGALLAGDNRAAEADLHLRRASALSSSYAQRVRADRAIFAEQYQERALSLARERRFEEARRALNDADTMEPELSRTLFLRGRVEALGGRLEEALIHYEKAYDAEPGNPDDARAYGEALVELGRRRNEAQEFAVATEYLEDAARVLDRGDVYYLLGTVSYARAQNSEDPTEQQQYLQQASAAFEKVLQRSPDDQDASYNLAAVHLALERYPEAVDIYRRLIRRNPSDGDLFMALALAHGRVGETDLAMAEEAAGRALRANHPVDDAGAWSRRAAQRFKGSALAEVYADLGVPEAIYTYQRLGGGLVEAWFYWNRGSAFVFRDGVQHGGTITLP